MSNFFEQELRKLFGDGEIIQSPHFVGRACLGTLDSDLRVRAEFVTAGVSGQYEALQLTVLKRTDGVVDTIKIRIDEMIGHKKIPNRSGSVSPYITWYRDEINWFLYQPNEADYQAMRQAAGEYLDVFRDRSQERSQPHRKASKRDKGER